MLVTNVEDKLHVGDGFKPIFMLVTNMYVGEYICWCMSDLTNIYVGDGFHQHHCGYIRRLEITEPAFMANIFTWVF